MIKVTGTLTALTADQADLVRAMLPEHIRLSQAEEGCLWFRVEPTEDPLVWRLDEAFRDRSAFQAHGLRTRASDWFTATAQMHRDFLVTEG